MADWHFTWTVKEHEKEDVLAVIAHHYGKKKATKTDVAEWFEASIDAEFETLSYDLQTHEESEDEEDE